MAVSGVQGTRLVVGGIAHSFVTEHQDHHRNHHRDRGRDKGAAPLRSRRFILASWAGH
jgi:hypothetical protein